MLSGKRQRLSRGRELDEGFTLIEVMVVVLIIGILLAIAIPSFLGARDRANDRLAQANLRHALTVEKVLFTDNQRYYDSSTNPTALQDVEPSLAWVAPATALATRNVAATVVSASSVVIAAQAEGTNTCWYVVDIAAPGVPSGTYYSSNKGGCLATPPSPPSGVVSRAKADANGADWALSF